LLCYRWRWASSHHGDLPFDDTLMLRLLPVRNPKELMELMHKYPGEPRGNSSCSWQSYEHFRKDNHVFSALTAFTDSHFSVRGGGLEAEAADYVPARRAACVGTDGSFTARVGSSGQQHYRKLER
jgi:hypothetical protein